MILELSFDNEFQVDLSMTNASIHFFHSWSSGRLVK